MTKEEKKIDIILKAIATKTDVVADLEKIRGKELKIEINLDEVPNQLELLKEKEGLSDKDIEILKKLLMKLIEDELKERDIEVSDEVKEYLLNLQVCFYLKEEQVKEEIKKQMLKRIATEVFSDDSTAKLAEKYQKKYGTLTEEDLDVVYFK